MAGVDEPIHLSEYDAQWPVQFEAEARRISACLSTDIAIEHIGSTSVPGLLAKPIIDLMVGTAPDHDLTAVRATLAAVGYEDLDEAGIPGRIYLRRRFEVAFNIALVGCGGAIWTSNLALRDYLRENAADAREYAEIKRKAFESGRRSLLAYSDYKSEFLARLIERALRYHRHP